MANKRNRWKQLFGASTTFICPYCQQVLPIKEATKTFLPPLSRLKHGHSYTIIPACKECNNEKGALTNKEYKKWKTEKDFFKWAMLEDMRNGKIK